MQQNCNIGLKALRTSILVHFTSMGHNSCDYGASNNNSQLNGTPVY